MCACLSRAQCLTPGRQVRHVGITGLPLAVFRRVLDQAPHGLVDVVRYAGSATMRCARIDAAVQVLSYCHYSLVDDTLASLLPYLQARRGS